MQNSKQLVCTIVKEASSENCLGNKIITGSWYKTIAINNCYRISFILPKQLIVIKRLESDLHSAKQLIYIFRTPDTRDFKTTIPEVIPKVELLFWCMGGSRVKKILSLLDEIKKVGIEFQKLSNEYWIHQHARIKTDQPLLLPKDVE